MCGVRALSTKWGFAMAAQTCSISYGEKDECVAELVGEFKSRACMAMFRSDGTKPR